MPLSPRSTAAHQALAPRPLGAATPIPVMKWLFPARTGAHGAAAGRGRVRTTALWNPPKPLPRPSTVSMRCSRAVSGV